MHQIDRNRFLQKASQKECRREDIAQIGCSSVADLQQGERKKLRLIYKPVFLDKE